VIWVLAGMGPNKLLKNSALRRDPALRGFCKCSAIKG
jgi:hypothetical protein